jgi:hypothetical protein
MDSKQYFKNHPGRTECFQTEDGFIFHTKNDAENHAKSLDKKTVNHVQVGKVETKAEAKVEIDEKKIQDETLIGDETKEKAPSKKAPAKKVSVKKESVKEEK